MKSSAVVCFSVIIVISFMFGMVVSILFALCLVSEYLIVIYDPIYSYCWIYT